MSKHGRYVKQMYASHGLKNIYHFFSTIKQVVIWCVFGGCAFIFLLFYMILWGVMIITLYNSNDLQECTRVHLFTLSPSMWTYALLTTWIWDVLMVLMGTCIGAFVEVLCCCLRHSVVRFVSKGCWVLTMCCSNGWRIVVRIWAPFQHKDHLPQLWGFPC